MSNEQRTLEDGITEYEAGNTERAIELFTSIKKEHDLAPINLSIILRSMGREQEAKSTLEDAILAGNSRSETFLGLGVIQKAEGKEEDAIHTWEEAIKQGKAQPETLYNLGIEYFAQERFEEAVTAFKGALPLKIHQAHYNLGLALCRTGKRKKAINVLKKAINAGFETEDMVSYLARLYSDTNQQKKAIELLEAFLEKFPTADIYNWLGTCHLELEQPKTAREYWETAVQKGAANSFTYHHLYSLTSQYKYAKAIIDIAKTPGNEDYLSYYVLWSLRNKIGGEETFQPLMRTMIEQMVKNDVFEKNLDKFRKGSNQLYVICSLRNSDLERIFAIKKGSKSFDRELKVRDLLEDSTGGTLATINPITTLKLNGHHYYVMERGHGPTLSKKIRKKTATLAEFVAIKRAMVHIHACVPTDTFEKYDLRKVEEVGRRFDPAILPFLPNLVSNMQGATPYVFNNDSQTDNWMFVPNVLNLDTEDKGSIPFSAEIAHAVNFLPWHKYAQDRMDEALSCLTLFNEETDQEIDPGGFLNEYLAWTIYRSFEKHMYYQSISRHQDARTALETGVQTINLMSKERVEEEYHLNIAKIFKNALLTK